MIAPVRPAEPGRRPTRRSREEDVARVPSHPTPGRSLVTRRALADIVRAATLGSYGVTGFAASPIERLSALLGMGQPGLRLVVAGDVLRIELHLTMAYGLPVAEVARQVDSAVRYAVQRSVGREVDAIAIHIGGLRYQPGPLPPGIPVEPSRGRADGALRPDDDLHVPEPEPIAAGRDAT
jgi:uncharacterized alkaline shock family protein YloU